MKTNIVLHKADPLAFYRAGDYNGGLPLRQFRPFKSVKKLREIVPVYINNIPAEGLPLLIKRLQVHNVTITAIYLQTVIIYNSHQVIQLKVSGSHSRFPHLSFIALPISQQHIRAVILRIKAPGQGYSGGEGQSLPQAAGRHFHPGSGCSVGMSLQATIHLPERG